MPGRAEGARAIALVSGVIVLLPVASCLLLLGSPGDVPVAILAAVIIGVALGSGRHSPRPTSTVVPGQLPIVRRAPVRALNSVDLPTLGVPAKATTGAPAGATREIPSSWQDGTGVWRESAS